MAKKGRIEKSAKNIAGNFVSNLICYILRFISRTVFIKTIGEFYLGVNGLLSNVLSILSLAELGISTAINYSLYKPLSDNNENKIAALMNFYKKAFRVIALVVGTIGLAILPFLDVIIKDNPGYDNLNLIYFIFLINMVISYLMSYKRTLLSADQKSYKISYYVTIATFVSTIIQIVTLIVTKNYILYLLGQTFYTVFENYLISRYADKEYPYLKTIKPEKLDDKEFEQIKTNVKALLLHRIGDTCVNSTDNIIISSFVSISIVGLYSNYLMLQTMIQGFILIIFNNLIASFGNLLAEGDKEKSYEIFKSVNFLSFTIYFIASICFLNLFNPFITLWIGKEWLLSELVVIVIVINFYMTGMRVALGTIRSAAGIYSKDKYDPIIQSIVNVIVSILLAKKYGILGVLIGTFASSLVPLIHRPYVIYKNVFEKKSLEYYVTYLKQFILVILTGIFTFYIVKIVNIQNAILKLVFNLVISVTLPTIIILLFYRNTKEFERIKNAALKLLNKVMHKKHNTV